jgi:hypothetical protein
MPVFNGPEQGLRGGCAEATGLEETNDAEAALVLGVQIGTAMSRLSQGHKGTRAQGQRAQGHKGREGVNGCAR